MLASTAKFAEAATVEAASGPCPEFCKVTVSGGLATAIWELPKLRMDGVAEMIGRVNPTPVRGMATVPCGSLLTILRVVLRFPPALGVKTSWYRQLFPLAIVTGGRVHEPPPLRLTT